MLFGTTLPSFVHAVGLLGLLGVVFAESGLLLGFFLPGDTLLFTAGFLTTKGLLGVPLAALIGLLFLAAVVGDSVGYAFGRGVGRRIFRRPDSILFHQDNFARAERFYERFGAITILLARFVPVVRTFAPVVAGVGRMEYRTFLIWNMGGGLIWTAGVTYLGFAAGAFFQAHGINIDNLLLPIVALVMLLSLVSPFYHIMREPRSRELLLQRIRFKPKKAD